MKFYLAGQHNFGNRGCEALVRSVTDMIREQLPHATFLVPTLDENKDRAQWKNAAANGCEFVAAAIHAPKIKWWNRLVSRVPSLLGVWEPRYTPAPNVIEDLKSVDAALMIGGDVISLDYGIGSLFLWSGLMDAAHRLGKPTMLFAASVGPFTKIPQVEKYMVNHLRRYSAITVRESSSFEYLQRLGLNNAQLVADPAFRLKRELIELPRVFATAVDGVLAFNISPLVDKSWQQKNAAGSLIQECVEFLRRVLAETKLNVLLLPHVDPLDGSAENSDTSYMARIVKELNDSSDRLMMLNRGFNAAQLKDCIANCRFLIAARTHATVAGWSQIVPTISIAYSVKAKGLNKDLFGSLDYLIDIPLVSRRTLWDALSLLQKDELEIRTLLSERIPLWKANSGKSALLLAKVLN